MIVIVAAFLAGILTILSPCTLPVVPLIFGASLAGRARRLGWILAGFVVSFVAVTVVLASALAALDLTTSTARVLAAIVLGLAGADAPGPGPRRPGGRPARSRRRSGDQAGTDRGTRPGRSVPSPSAD